MDARKSRFVPNTPDPLCAKDTRHLTRFVRNGSIQRSPHPWHMLSLKFGIFIWGRNSNTCQKNKAITDLLNKTKIRQVYYCSGPYTCHTKAMTALVEFGTRCLYEDTNFYSVLIVRSASWLKLKSSHFRICFEKNFSVCQAYAETHGNIFNCSKTVCMTFKAKSAKSTVTPLLTNGWQKSKIC